MDYKSYEYQSYEGSRKRPGYILIVVSQTKTGYMPLRPREGQFYHLRGNQVRDEGPKYLYKDSKICTCIIRSN